MPGFVYTCSTNLGILPFGKDLKFSRWRGLISVIGITALTNFALTMRAFKLKDSIKDVAKGMVVKTILENLQYISQIVFIFTHTMITVLYRAQIQTLLKHCNFNYENSFDSISTIFILVLAIIKGFPGAVNSKLVYYVKFDEILSALYVFLSYLILLQFCCMLRSVAKDIRLEVERVCKLSFNLRAIPRFVRLLEKINSTYNVQILFLTAQILQYVCASGYIVLSQALIKQEFPFFVFPNLMNVVIRFAMLHSLVTSCGLAQKQVDRFNRAFFKAVIESRSLCRQSKIQLFLSMRHSVEFTAFGFYSIGHPIALSVISASVTYLVVLLEFARSS